MNTGQMLMAGGALVILSMIFLVVNRTFANSSDVLVSTKLDVLAVSLATSFLEDASSKAFDAITVGNAVNSLDSLTKPHSLGPSSEEVYPNFNDFDDFNGLSIIDSNTINGVQFRVNCRVQYVDENDPRIIRNTATWHKRLTVNVTPVMRDTVVIMDSVVISSVQSYFYFR
jgi:hypothetical protein